MFNFFEDLLPIFSFQKYLLFLKKYIYFATSLQFKKFKRK